MESNNTAIKFFYGTALGRMILKLIMSSHLDKAAVKYLRSTLSRSYIRRFAKNNGLEFSEEELGKFRTYRDFFLRDKNFDVDGDPTHLISPCDSWLSAFKIEEDSAFRIKGSLYKMEDLIGDCELIKKYAGGDCLIFRLCASDYHHYCYIDDCVQKENHFIPGKLHSVQPLACETYPVYSINRRNWCVMETVNFGDVIQTEVGALIVGGIVNHHENAEVKRGDEKGHFDLAGSTIVLFFEAGRMKLRSDLVESLKREPEVRVEIGEAIGEKI